MPEPLIVALEKNVMTMVKMGAKYTFTVLSRRRLGNEISKKESERLI